MSSQPQIYKFPYEPYPEQRNLMHAIYECIDSSSVGCFESPTGTGKSLSAICASFDWLLKEEKRILSDYAAAETASKTTTAASGADWLSSFYTQPNIRTETSNKIESVAKYKLMLEKIAKSNDKKPLRNSLMLNRGSSKHTPEKNASTEHATITTSDTTSTDTEESEFALKPYNSEDEAKTHHDLAGDSSSDHSDSDNSTSRTNTHKHKPQSVMDILQLPQIFYCSRTHSQLAQFIAEMNKTEYCKIDPATNIAPIRCVTLGSRRNLCVNESVVKLKSESSMSEACLDMQKKGSKSSGDAGTGEGVRGKSTGAKRTKLHNHTKCPHHLRSQEQALSQRSLGLVQDIEDIRRKGVESGTCAYYATRCSVGSANVVCLPYNLLLNKDMRESLSLNLQGKVIIFDEAHNLIETINSLYSAEVSVAQIDAACSAISMYLRRFSTVLSGKNLYYVNLLSVVLTKVRKVLCPKVAVNKSSNSTTGGGGVNITNNTNASTTATSITTNTSNTTSTTNATLTVNDFLFKSKLDGVNLFRLRKHIIDTNLVNKIGGYVDGVNQREAALSVQIHTSTISSASGNKVKGNHTIQVHANTSKTATTTTSTNNNNTSTVKSSVLSALRCALELVTCLTNLEGDGRVFLLNMPASGSTSTVISAGSSNASNTNGASGAGSTNSTPNTANTANTTHTTNTANHATTSTANTPNNATTSTTPTIRYVMLNPSVHFLPLLTSARSVLLLGGTMQPFQYFTSLLLPSIPPARLRLFSCEHVVPASQVGAVVVTCGYVTNSSYSAAFTNTTINTNNSHTTNNTTNTNRKVNFDFTYDKRNSPELTTALFNTLLDICLNTPGGVVVFCTSFSYLDTLLQRWRTSKLLYKLDAVKRVFAESRNASDAAYSSRTNSTASNTTNTNTTNTDSDQVWEAYKAHLTAHPAEGGVLFSVINGKLSEGINFSDHLARCVVVVGMPYPDTRDAVLQEKMRYVTYKEAGSFGGISGGISGGSASNSTNTHTSSYTSTVATSYNSPAGRRLCEHMCMRAVNQSVGRAIRHIRDYACVVLLDRRYCQEHMRAQLPRWLTRGLQLCSGGDSSTVSGGGSCVGEAKLTDALKTFFEQQEVY